MCIRDSAGLGNTPGNDKTSDATLNFAVAGDPKYNEGHKTGKELGTTESRISTERQKAYGRAQNNDCLRARRCLLTPKKAADSGEGCCPGQTGHHVVPDSSFKNGDGSETPLPGCENYNPKDAPCICVEGASSTKGSHGLMHNHQYVAILDHEKHNPGQAMTYSEQRDSGIAAIQDVFKGSGCSKECLTAQLDAYHTSEEVGIAEDAPLHASKRPGRNPVEARRTTDHVNEIRLWARRQG